MRGKPVAYNIVYIFKDIISYVIEFKIKFIKLMMIVKGLFINGMWNYQILEERTSGPRFRAPGNVYSTLVYYTHLFVHVKIYKNSILHDKTK